MVHNDGTPRRPCPRCGELDRALHGDVVPPEIKGVLKRAATPKPLARYRR